MSRHKFVKGMNLDAELDIFDGGHDDEYDDSTVADNEGREKYIQAL